MVREEEHLGARAEVAKDRQHRAGAFVVEVTSRSSRITGMARGPGVLLDAARRSAR